MPDTLKSKQSIEWHGGIYCGPMLKQLPVGNGKWKKDNGDWLKGIWQINPYNDQQSWFWIGVGHLTLDNGDVKEGSFVESRFHKGTVDLTKPNGDFFKGEWYDDQFQNGECRITIAENSVFEGICKNSRLEKGLLSVKDEYW